MAVEHRYAHEYGELSSASIPSMPQTPRSARPSSGRSPKASAHTGSAGLSVTHTATTEGDNSQQKTLSQHSAVLDLQKPSGPTETQEARTVSPTKEKSPLPKLSEKEKFEMALRGEVPGKFDASAAQDSSHHAQSSVPANSITGATGFHHQWGDDLTSAADTGHRVSLSGVEKKDRGMSVSGAGDMGQQRLQEDSLQQVSLLASLLCV